MAVRASRGKKCDMHPGPATLLSTMVSGYTYRYIEKYGVKYSVRNNTGVYLGSIQARVLKE
jgi:hypothetical protein